MVKVKELLLKEGIGSQSGSEFFPLREVPILKRELKRELKRITV